MKYLECLAIVACLLLHTGSAEREGFVGWQGDTYNTDERRAMNAPWIETISWSPRAFIYHGFLTDQECDHLVGIGTKRVSQSLVIDTSTGKSKQDKIRTSYGGSFSRGEDPVVAEIEQRIGEWTHLPPAHGEPMQILRYVNGQKYGAHWDYFVDPQHSGPNAIKDNRYATVLMYLSEVEEGGETTLPLGEPLHPDIQSLENPSPCAEGVSLAVRPRKGDALLFFDMDIAGGKMDRKALHASCPTIRGTKWTATKWIHNMPYGGGFNPIESAGKCVDKERDCAERARNGDCDSDPNMIGPAGVCRLTCQDCEVCASGDILCFRKNMRSRRAQLAEA